MLELCDDLCGMPEQLIAFCQAPEPFFQRPHELGGLVGLRHGIDNCLLLRFESTRAQFHFFAELCQCRESVIDRLCKVANEIQSGECVLDLLDRVR